MRFYILRFAYKQGNRLHKANVACKQPSEPSSYEVLKARKLADGNVPACAAGSSRRRGLEDMPPMPSFTAKAVAACRTACRMATCRMAVFAELVSSKAAPKADDGASEDVQCGCLPWRWRHVAKPAKTGNNSSKALHSEQGGLNNEAPCPEPSIIISKAQSPRLLTPRPGTEPGAEPPRHRLSASPRITGLSDTGALTPRDTVEVPEAAPMVVLPKAIPVYDYERDLELVSCLMERALTYLMPQQ